ncbi:MAG TPA: protein phosphatase 2C domain-containing protein [Vicinamibacterales bacterium]
MTKQEDEARRHAFSQLLTADDFRPLSATVQVEIGARSHRGTVQLHNEDHYLAVELARRQQVLTTSLTGAEVPARFEEHGYAMLVADGLGTTGAGAMAGRVAISTIAHLALHYGRWSLRVDPKTAEDLFARAQFFYTQADAAVMAKSRTSPALEHMATALTAAYSAGSDLIVAHVGHTRAYLYRGGHLLLLTRDHTVEKQLADVGRPVAIERRGQDLQHILTDAVGAGGERPMVDVEQFKLEDGDVLLLCTNGLSDVVDEDRIADVLSMTRRSEDQCQMLVDLALEAGGPDNVTVLMAQYRVPRS